jgi:hypothetical protein
MILTVIKSGEDITFTSVASAQKWAEQNLNYWKQIKQFTPLKENKGFTEFLEQLSLFLNTILSGNRKTLDGTHYLITGPFVDAYSSTAKNIHQSLVGKHVDSFIQLMSSEFEFEYDSEDIQKISERLSKVEVVRQIEPPPTTPNKPNVSISTEVNEAQEAIDYIINKAHTDIENIKLSLLDRKSLEEPSTHWDQKSRLHQVASRFWLIASIIWLCITFTGGIMGTYWLTNNVIKPDSGTAILPIGATAVAAVKTVEKADTALLIAMITTYALTTISVFRFMTRLFRDERRLADDSVQRKTMMESYLSMLTHKSSPIGPEERILVLHALFRGAALADSSDDVPVVNIADALLNAVKKKDS